jgi:hypothetical protein
MTKPAPVLLDYGIFNAFEHQHGAISNPGTDESPIGLAPRSCNKSRRQLTARR